MNRLELKNLLSGLIEHTAKTKETRGVDISTLNYPTTEEEFEDPSLDDENIFVVRSFILVDTHVVTFGGYAYDVEIYDTDKVNLNDLTNKLMHYIYKSDFTVLDNCKVLRYVNTLN